MHNYSIKKIEKDNFHLLIPLMKDSFGMDVNVDYFVWKYLKNPSGDFIGFIAEDEFGEIGAYYGVIPEMFWVHGEKKTIFQSCDTMTHSNHRRRGLFKMLALYCYKYLKNESKCLIYGFGGGQSTPGFLKFGWKKNFEIKYYFLPTLFHPIYSFKNTTNVITISPNLILKEIEKFNYKKTLIHPIINESVILWRLSNPLHKYETKVFKRKNDEIGAYIIYKVENKKLFLFSYGYDNIRDFKSILNSLLIECKTKKYKGIFTFSQEGCEFSKKLISTGFIYNGFKFGPLSDKTPFITFTDGESIIGFEDKNNWNVNPFHHDAL